MHILVFPHLFTVCRMSEEEDDVHDKIDPTVQYLHKLGPAHLELIFEASKWVFDISLEAGLDVSDRLRDIAPFGSE